MVTKHDRNVDTKIPFSDIYTLKRPSFSDMDLVFEGEQGWSVYSKYATVNAAKKQEEQHRKTSQGLWKTFSTPKGYVIAQRSPIAQYQFTLQSLKNQGHNVEKAGHSTKPTLRTTEWITNHLPHGSGINGDWNITDKGSYVMASCSYEAMNENGFYDGWQDFTVTIPKDNPTDFKLQFNGNQYLAQKYSLRDYLIDTIDTALSE